ncbi:MAG: polysaccharide ABC transporter [Ruminococcaceae bacterium]|nr:polysaccharide ABC transporter [Oscillospiraceae bacterium]
MFKQAIFDIKKYFPYSVKAARFQLKNEVASSFLNWVWWVLDPLCFMLIYTIVFGYIFKSKEQYFPIFIFIGISLWDFFKRTLASAVRVVKANKPTISRVYLPKYILIFINMWTNAFKMAISFAIVFAMMVVWWVPLSWNILWFPLILVVMVAVTFGFSCFLLHYGVYVDDLTNVVDIALRAMFYVTGIFYSIESRLAHYGPILVRLNPMACVITAARDVLIYGQAPDLPALGVWFVIGLLLSMLGIRKIYKEENSYVKVI